MSSSEYIRERPFELGPIIGSFPDSLIYAWIRLEDGVYDFQGVAPGPTPGVVDLSRLCPGEIVLRPGLLYRNSPGHR